LTILFLGVTIVALDLQWSAICKTVTFAYISINHLLAIIT